VSQTGPRFYFAYKVATTLNKNNGIDIVLFGNGIYNIKYNFEDKIKKDDFKRIFFLHKPSMVERGIKELEIPNNMILIDDDALLDLILMSEKTLCI
jgi:sulfur relay (sulfurtransferase) DsrF/TusC family protein